MMRRVTQSALPLPPVASARPLQVLLLATDLGDASEAATAQAIALATQLSARLLVVAVIDPRPRRGPRPRPVEERERISDAVHEVAARAQRSGATASFLVWDGDPAESILAAAEAESADLIVVGSHRRSPMGRAILGSVSDQVVRSASCPVLVVPPTAG
jgi:nucleotide-binding universal stress UspA family protein